MKKIIFTFLIASALSILISSCSKDNEGQPVATKTYVIVPGAWSSASAWQAVAKDLSAAGNKVIVVELPGHGTDQTAPQSLTIDIYRDKVISAMNSVDGKVILVGHSMAGVVISEVAEKVPAKIEKLIYLAAFLPQTGQSLFDLASTDATSLLGSSLILAPGVPTVDVKHENIINCFIADGTTAVQNALLASFRVEPAPPFQNPVTLTKANYGSVPKFYIKTLQDQTITPILQKRMLANAGISTTYQLNTSHSPFLSKPDSVAILLTAIAK
ncbi:alpha/beta fold hydrolase [Mucilaginibacter sp.]|jgi:pimeloyl-ACP methyl ester carboxylesterase|uniref:alpha/beta fold hydrolase n=1 Tax=Mucilaginibacter sp. TaxID=1882438 RepID=UPI003561A5D7